MAGIVEQSHPSIAVDPWLHGRLGTLAAGRTLVIGYFASRRCGVVIGDFAVDWQASPPGLGFLELAPIEGVAAFVDARLVDVLVDARPELRPGGILRPGTPSVRLGIPERWIEFLDGPTVLTRRPSENGGT